jgi:alkanesulfonate monooxygenase SsuD/methylene tetrahydromethanopterin reductase-like flavin-dependent oxidoreductase (luciferase family)
MKFGLLTEGEVPKGLSYSARYHEIIKEAVFAEEMGFDFWGTSEQHFVPSAYAVSAPETLYGAVAALTSKITIRHMSVVMLRYNHPIRIAERVATLDILCKGRLELGTARSNNIEYLKAFGVDPVTTREEYRETVEVVVRALMESPFEYHGKFYDFGPTNIVPRLHGPKCPPLYVSATSVETHRSSGELGIGSMTHDNWFGWDYMKQCVSAHKEGLRSAQPIGGLYAINPNLGLLTFPAHVAATRAKAIEEARHSVLGLFNHVSQLYLGLARAEKEKGGTGYSYFEGMEALVEKGSRDIEYLIDNSPTILIGDPEQVIKRIKEYEAAGFDEVILKIDGYGHSAVMRSIEMFGKYVFPEFRNPRGIPANDWESVGVPVPSYLL